MMSSCRGPAHEQHLGKYDDGVWTRAIAIGSRYNVAEHSSRAFSQNNSGVEIGADKAIALANGKASIGGILGTAQPSLSFGDGRLARSTGWWVPMQPYLDDSGVYVIKYARFYRPT